MNYTWKRVGALACAVGMLLGTPVMSAAATYNDFDAITNHVKLAVSQKLNITRPSKDLSTAAANYYLMGNSDPNQELYLNGKPVGSRGKFGSFGVYVSLAYGQNLVEFTQGSDSERVVITRSDTAQSTGTTTVASSLFPTYDDGYKAGDDIELSCIAPSGGRVTAYVGQTAVPLKQSAATARQGIPAWFRSTIRLPETNGTVSLGTIRYVLEYNGGTATYTSAGRLFTTGSASQMRVQMTQVSAAIMQDATPNSGYLGTAKKNAVDTVVGRSGDRYQLSMGGWISKANVQPLEGNGSVHNTVQSVHFQKESNGERYTLTGTSNPIVTSYQTAEKLYVELHNTTGIQTIPVGESRLFSSVKVTDTGKSTVLEFMLQPGATLWGYVVQYENGATTLFCKQKPTLSGDPSQPLKGITVVLDSGHGSRDSGALGLSQTEGPTESDINRATAVAVQKRLQSLGANAILPEQFDLNSRFNERMQPAIDSKADVFISLHCNSIVENSNGLTPKGIEIYYFEKPGQALGTALMNPMIANTGRASRGVRYAAFRVTLNSLAPSVLVEMGFMTNPIEYDDLCSKEGIFRMANAVGEGVVALLA